MADADVLIIGAGASGLAAAAEARRKGERVLLLEAQSRPGRKILASGNGRCNLLNLNPPVYYGDSAFAKRVIENCGAAEIIRFFESIGLKVRDDGEGRVYPYTLQSSTVLESLLHALESAGVSILTGQRVSGLKKNKNSFEATALGGERFFGGRVIVCAGSPAHPDLGGCGDAPGLLLPFGHRRMPFRPVLTPLTAEKRSISGLSGIRVRCHIRVLNDEKEVYRNRGEALFTEDGISGICVMQCARFVEPGVSVCELNLIPGLFSGRDEALEYLQKQRSRCAGSEPVRLIEGICVPRLAFAICKQAGMALRGEKCAELTDKDLEAVYQVMTHYRVRITGTKGLDRAQSAAGGLDCGDFEPSRMESRLIPGLHAAGEALNVDGDCGGFNLMFAWASGLLAGRNGDVPSALPAAGQKLNGRD